MSNPDTGGTGCCWTSHDDADDDADERCYQQQQKSAAAPVTGKELTRSAKVQFGASLFLPSFYGCQHALE